MFLCLGRFSTIHVVNNVSFGKMWHLLKMLLEALSAIDAAHMSVIHGLVSASRSWISTRNESYEPRCREQLLEIQRSNSSRISQVYNDKGCSDRQKGQTIYVIRQHSRSISKFRFQCLLLASYQVAVQQFVVLCALNDVLYVSAIYYLYQVLLRDGNCPFHAEFVRRARLWSSQIDGTLCSAHEKGPLPRRLFPRRARSRPNPSTRHILIYRRALECDLEP